MVSDVFVPEPHQLQYLFARLASCKTQELLLSMLPSIDMSVPAAFNKHAKPVLQQLLACKQLLSSLLTLDISSLAISLRYKPLIAGLSACTSLRSLRLGQATALGLPELHVISQLTQLQQLHVHLSEADMDGEEGMQQALDSLAGLQKLQDLETNFTPSVAKGKTLALPSWPHLTRLVESSMGPSAPAPRLLPACVCEVIQELNLAGARLPQGCKALPQLRELGLAHGVELGGVALPRVSHLVVLGKQELQELRGLVQCLAELEVRRVCWCACHCACHGMHYNSPRCLDPSTRCLDQPRTAVTCSYAPMRTQSATALHMMHAPD
jgi:hypothetical protein